MRKKKLSHKVVKDTKDQVLELEANIDDQAPETLAPVLDRLLQQGAYDAFFTPIQMKKNRPAVKLTVLGDPQAQDTLVHTILKHTSTVGVRYQLLQRAVMQREFMAVQTTYGAVNVKVVRYGDIQKATPEFEDCQKLALSQNLAIQQVYQAVYQQLGNLNL